MSKVGKQIIFSILNFLLLQGFSDNSQNNLEVSSPHLPQDESGTEIKAKIAVPQEPRNFLRRHEEVLQHRFSRSVIIKIPV